MGIFKEKKCFTDEELMEMLEEAMEIGMNKAKKVSNSIPQENSNAINNLKDSIKQKKSRISELTLNNSDIKDENLKLKKQLNIEKNNSKTFLETIYEQQKLLEKITRKLQSKDTNLYEVVNQLVINIEIPKKQKKIPKKNTTKNTTTKPTIDTIDTLA